MRSWRRSGMDSSPIEFRLRVPIHLILFVLGFVAPWDYWLHLDGSGPNAHVWGSLSVLISQSGLATIGTAFDVVLCAGILCALAAAWLRTWGAAYLGVEVVQAGKMHGERVETDGPYRHVRNPLYLGTSLQTLALALLMPPSGAIFAIATIALFQLRLILGEQAFLTRKLGAAYIAYCAAVPRLLPSLRPRAAASGARPRWMRAVLGEIGVWGVAVSFAVFGWRYNALLLTRCVLISLGVSIIARALWQDDKPQ